MIIVILLLYILTSIGFSFDWPFVHSAFIANGQNFWTIYLRLSDPKAKAVLSIGTTGILCTVLADSVIIWRCWIIWGRRWLIALFPALCLVSSIVFKIMDMRLIFTDGNDLELLYRVLYASFTLVTTLSCTLGIVYRILSVVQASPGEGGRYRAYRRVIEVLVESSTLYSIILILYVAFFAHDDWAANYLDPAAAIARGVAPTLLVGRVAAGHARPDDSWEGSVMSSLRFGEDPIETSSYGDTVASVIIDDDLESQPSSEGEGAHTRSCFQGGNGPDVIPNDNPDIRPGREMDGLDVTLVELIE
ncbi:uncharacterized protein BT62DRAFT_271728 [Guyanagaster necrorhizus]|uniref:Uncharacterized protein n=1 Tax=Guyanagaster necrorhizus TaxID=856835 RepID=A0A9P8AXZ6_9AGAR|nr:uncharacterized protein BT62DRAFT_271728 [Guyanagaster necrorhizus MCA 3950]KAG7451925.1 hypothetical protein BT62DRAFT_271728 [Guyanagaster necrorhizus MCA 3950]